MGEIDAKIEDGSYFAEAKKWYNEIFLRPAVMNAVMRFVAYVVICVACIAIYNISNNFPLNRKVTIVAHLANTAQYYPVIKKLHDADGVRKAVVRYLSERYIKSREVYNPDFFSQNYFFIQQSSEKKVFDEYYASLQDKKNEAVDLFKLGSQVQIVPILTEYDLSKSQIFVTFEKKIFSKEKNLNQNLRFKATINFYMSPYDFSESVTEELNFIVTSYKLEQVKK